MEETLSPSESTLLVTIISSNRALQTPEVFFYFLLRTWIKSNKVGARVCITSKNSSSLGPCKLTNIFYNIKALHFAE